MNRNRILFSLLLAWLAVVATSATASAQATLSYDALFRWFSAGDGTSSNPGNGTFYLKVINRSRGVSITKIELTVGNTDKHFDAAYYFSQSSGVTVNYVRPDQDAGGGATDSLIVVGTSGMSSNRSVQFKVDIDNNKFPADARRVLFNNGTKPNAILTITGSNGETAEITLPDGSATKSSYLFQGGAARRNLNVQSVVEAAVIPGVPASTTYVDEVDVVINPARGANVASETPNAPGRFNLTVYDGDVVKITAPERAYRDLAGAPIPSSVLSDPGKIEELAEERFTANGISVNDIAPTGDATSYEFEIDGDTVALVKWKHDYALRIESDFSATESDDPADSGEIGTDGNPIAWAGPLTSQANGSPTPTAGTLHWIERDTPVVAAIESSYIDRNIHHGQEIRFVPYAYLTYGAANKDTQKATDEAARKNAAVRTALIDARTSPNDELTATVGGASAELRKRREFTVGQSPDPTHQLDSFTMYGPAEIRYLWKIQYGVRIAADSAEHDNLPLVIANGGTLRREGTGVFWFDQDVDVRITSAAQASSASDAKTLTGWITGDGYYFNTPGTVSSDGTIAETSRPRIVDGQPVATWDPSIPTGEKEYGGMSIPHLRRPAAVQWKYGSGAIRTEVTVGEYIFQHEPDRAALFRSEPTVNLSSPPTNTDLATQGVWDPEAGKFYPLGAGNSGPDSTNQFELLWTPEGGTDPVEVQVTVRWPNPAHYPHVAGAPAVALDPDPTDNFLFKEMKYSESSASINDENHFIASGAGRSVLLFANVQRDGRGQPREFLQVRVVETKTLDNSITGIATPRPVVIGEKIRDREFDQAQLETGWIVGSEDEANPTLSRYNPFIYDPSVLDAMAAQNIYDTDLLFSDSGVKAITSRSALPGPVIPVNFDPSPGTDLLRVVWYDDPTQNDGLLWPHRGRAYAPGWPQENRYTETVLATTADGSADPFGRSFDALSGISSIAIDGQLAFITSSQESALTIVDINDPTAPRLISIASDTLGNFGKLDAASQVVVANGLAAVAAPNADAITLVDVTTPVSPQLFAELVDGSGGFDSLAGVNAIALGDGLLFAASPTDDAVTIIDISNPAVPRHLAAVTDGVTGANSLHLSGNSLFVTGSDGLSIIDVADPTLPVVLSTTLVAGARDVLTDGEFAFVAGTGGVAVLDFDDPTAPVLESTLTTVATQLALEGDRLYAASVGGGAAYNLADRAAPTAISGATDAATALAVSGGLLIRGSNTGFVTYEVNAERVGRIVIASQWGSESEDAAGRNQLVAPAAGGFTRSTIYDPSRLQQVQVYSQPDKTQPGYNPNEEHAVMAPPLRYADVAPRPPAAYALRDNDLNVYPGSPFPTNNKTGDDYTSHPFVLVQFFDVAADEFKMNVYKVQAEDGAAALPTAAGSKFETFYRFADIPMTAITAVKLAREPYVRMEAGEPVIPFYPIGFVDGAVPCPQTYGTDLLSQKTYWEDHRGSNWAISGGDKAWFYTSPHYRMLPSFWWPITSGNNPVPKPGALTETRSTDGASFLGTPVVFDISNQTANSVFTGDCVSFLPEDITTLLEANPGSVVQVVGTPRSDSVNSFAGPVPLEDDFTSQFDMATDTAAKIEPTQILYKSDWPASLPTLKAGETLTFSGGEYRADNPTLPIADSDGEVSSIPTPGLPQLTAFSSAEVVFDSLNPTSNNGKWKRKSNWSARVAQVLDVRRYPLKVEDFPPALQPANGKTRVKGGKYIFVDLPASLQKRVRYNPLVQYKEDVTEVVDGATVVTGTITRTGALEVIGLLNDKDIGDPTLTAAPPAVYVLEPNILTAKDAAALRKLDGASGSDWDAAVDGLRRLTRNPNELNQPEGQSNFYVGLEGEVARNSVTGEALRVAIEPGSTVTVPRKRPGVAAPVRAFGPGLALIPNDEFLNPNAGYPDVSYVTVVENNDPSLGGSPITPHIIIIDRGERYRGSIKTVESDNVFDENMVLRHTGDFGTSADELFFEWWYRPDNGQTQVAPPDLLLPGEENPWKLFPDDSGDRGKGRYEITLEGNPNAPETLIADTFWFVRYRHKNDVVNDTDWGVTRPDGTGPTVYTWAGAGNSQPFEDFDNDGIRDFRAQLAQGWIKRVLDAVNPYEARIRDFDGDNPATVTSMLQQFGPRAEGAVALNPDKNVIENVGLIELYETILNRARSLTIDLSRPVASPAIANALQLASTRLADFYTLLGNEAYVDSLDPTIGVEDGQLPPTVFSFQNQANSRLAEELGLLRGVDEFYARPVYNRLFWNFTKGEGEAAYALNYNVSDINTDGFIDEDDAMILYPQGHGDAWGHYLTALRHQYDLLAHPFFNWVSRSEFYNLQDIVIEVDFLDERKFAATAAAKAKAGAEIVDQTYREKYVEDPNAQWQGYTDSNKDRSWGVQGWARRAGQGAYFDWVTANALLPAEHPDATLEGLQKVDRQSNADINVISANLNAIQRTFDEANAGSNPLGIPRDAVTFDIDPTFIEVGSGIQGELHFEQIYQRATAALDSANAVWQNANEVRNRLRGVASTEQEFREATFEQDLAYRNELIGIFGKPYIGTIGPGQLYPAGYEGPDLALYMYVDVREITHDTVPGPTSSFAVFNEAKGFNDGTGALFDALADGNNSSGSLNEEYEIEEILTEGYASTFASTFASASNQVDSNLFAVNYTDLDDPKIPLEGLAQAFPIKAAGYTFQAPNAWGNRAATGELQLIINQMIQQEAEIAAALGAWDGLQGAIVRELQIISARLDASATVRQRNKSFLATKYVFDTIFQALETAKGVSGLAEEVVVGTIKASGQTIPLNLPTGGLAVSPGDALFAARGGFELSSNITKSTFDGVQAALDITKLIEEIIINAVELANQLKNENDELTLEKKEWLKGLEDLAGDEPVLRIAVFKEIQALRELSDTYLSKLDEGIRLIEERQAFNKRVAAQTQLQRYNDMTLRVSRNAALQAYRGAFDLAARYAYMAGKAYDYETNFAPGDPGSPNGVLKGIVGARGLGQIDDGPQLGQGGIAGALATLKTNFEAQRGQLGINNPQLETGKMSLRTEMRRILPDDDGGTADIAWKQALNDAYVEDLWMEPDFRHHCRGFAPEKNALGKHIEQPGLILRFGTQIIAGENFFGHPLGGGDQAYDASSYATKILGAGIWFSDYESDDLFGDLSEAPRVYLLPTGTDIMSVPNIGVSPTAGDESFQRLWNVVDASIPVPIPATQSALDSGEWVPIIDGLNGRIGDPRKFASFRAYHGAGPDIDDDELVFDSRLVGRSVWNTEWVLIIPGLTLNADADEGLRRFIEQVSDIQLVFQTYGYRGS